MLRSELNWNDVLLYGFQHKVAPLVYERLRNLNPPELASDHLEGLSKLARDMAKSNLALMGEMLSLCDNFGAANIPAIPFKGPALAWLSYPNFAQRSSVDLDFVVPQRYIPDVVPVLQKCGYTPQFSMREAQAGESGPAPGQYLFTPTANRRFVEVHTERTLRYFPRPLDFDQMYARLIPVEIGGKHLRTFSVEDQLVMLCVHGAKHLWERLSWIVDIAQLITAREVDWPLLWKIAAGLQSKQVLLVGLYLAHEVVGVALPPAALAAAHDDAQVQWLVEYVLAQYEGNADANAGIWMRANFSRSIYPTSSLARGPSADSTEHGPNRKRPRGHPIAGFAFSLL